MKLVDFLAEPVSVALPVEHLSVSQVQMLNRCEEQYRQRYVLGKKERPGAALIVGGAFHSATEFDFTSKLNTSGLASDTDLEAFYHTAFDERIEDAGGVNEVSWDVKEKPDTARLHGLEATKLYHSRIAPDITPLAVEEKFNVEVPGCPVPVVGVIDLIHERESRRLTDYKTSARAQRELKPDWRLQGMTYQYARGGDVEWHVVVKGAKPNILTPLDTPGLYQFEEPGTKAFVERTFTLAALKIQWLMSTFGPDESWPTNGFSHPWSCRFCGYKRDCIAWRRA